ncbi:unnamed protein product [marine sediment metagenome]|uniref:Uncharacterized protein n=1 Tax=marine sediment metagenome TaxID=412755 RepID=X1BDA7_9ZZZZ
MNKLGHVAVVVGLVLMVYLILLITVPFLSSVAVDVASNMTADHPVAQYPGAVEGLLMAPWLLFFAPGVIGLIAVVVILKRP